MIASVSALTLLRNRLACYWCGIRSLLV